MPEQSGSPMPAHAVPTLVPADEHNRTLLHNVHPPDWRNPEPAPRYNLVVIGAGTAGLVTAAGAAGLAADPVGGRLLKIPHMDLRPASGSTG